MAIKAYTVSRDSEYPGGMESVIVFSQYRATAQRKGANRLDTDFESVACKRSPEFDQYAPGPVPPLVLIEHGWWFECCGCYKKIDSDKWDDENEVALDPVDHKGDLYCSAECRDDDLSERAERKKQEDIAKAIMTAEALALYPGITLDGLQHAFVSQDGEAWVVRQSFVEFTFPGAKHGKGHLERREGGDLELLIPNGDVEAWHRWRAEART